MFLSNGREIWQPWFKKITPWEVECVPQHAWCEEAFSIIATNTDSPNLAFGRVGILTSHPDIVSSSITILVDGIPCKINVMEYIFESLKLSPVLAANDFYQKMSWWDEDSTGENDNLNSEGPIQPEDMLESLEVSPVKVHQPRHQEGGEEESHGNSLALGTKESPRNSKTGEPRMEFVPPPLSDSGNAPFGNSFSLGQKKVGPILH
uniref:Uncharacterized protein n=1 Tax=Lactuca sativa TaxID=4236 RepID=A0A9R1VLF8_LACSA|nr:hypothetical protein LSAT_V11C500242850 [Lactuca sativa]